jgi:hypothetical protein
VKSLYIIGSLRNVQVSVTAAHMRAFGYDVFDDWFAAGPEADDWWKTYEIARGRTYQEALNGYAANQVFRYDKSHLDRCQAAVLVLPAGKSGHLELGYFIGTGKPGYVMLPEGDDRWDVMYRFATAVVRTPEGLNAELAKL